MRFFTWCFVLLVAWGGSWARVRAEPELASYALLIGSNRGGAGQQELSFAQQDAERMGQLLTELGRTPRERVRVLQQPSSATVQRELHELRDELAAQRAQGKRTQLLFYYSGHARSHALSLGSEELSLDTLRTALNGLPTTLTVVVLDACQSGAFSGVKGASAAADFSTSSVAQLPHQGLAVMASSTGSELSQESPELSSSYFTHHLMVALRGAGDRDGNGRVALDEAYRYAYEHTLSDTARTQVGSQHATLETNLRGSGDVALTYPRDADAQLILPGDLVGRVLVQRARRGAVVAELVKERGADLRLALPSGQYDLLLRSTRESLKARECPFTLQRGDQLRLDVRLCTDIELPPPHKTKGDDSENEFERWFVELGLTISQPIDDGYTDTLNGFRYEEQVDWLYPGSDLIFLDAALGYGLHRNVSLTLRWDQLEVRRYERKLQGQDENGRHDTFDWRTHALSLGVRPRLPIWREYIVAVAELDLGLGIARTNYEIDDGPGSKQTGSTVERRLGAVFRAAAGFTFGFNDHFGVYFLGGYVLSRALTNDIGDTHNDGGIFLSAGLRLKSPRMWW